MSGDESETIEASMFEEPEDFRPPTPPATYTTFTRDDENVEEGTPKEFDLRLVGHHSLWAHCLWNAGVALAHYIDKNKSLVKGKRILELGAAAACPSFVSALCGAEKVVSTDYPEAALIENIARNASDNLPEKYLEHVDVKGHLWGSDPSELLALIGTGVKYDVILLADLIFNHNQHVAMLTSCDQLLRNDDQGEMYVFFTHHRPQYAAKDMNFFTLAQSDPFNFTVTHLKDINMPVMFPTDPGDET
eukprot:Ihof_evm4s252 gene=Ihof_evmTU4s252